MPNSDPESRCANCGQPLTPADKFCRQCGLPSIRQAHRQHQVPAPPDTGEFQRALDAQPDPKPFIRTEPEVEPVVLPAEVPDELTTGDVIRATNPTQAFQSASVTLVMIGVIALVAAVAGMILLVLALKP